MTLTISAPLARRAILNLQGLADPPRRRLTQAGLVALIERLGFVQLDSINRLERAHHMILFSRNETYRPAMLRTALEQDRTLFEHWTHDAAVIPCCFYRHWQHRFRREAPSLARRFNDWRGDFSHRLEELLDRIRVDGPIAARQVREDHDPGSAGWWQWHPGKTALEYLWRSGQLAVTGRQGFQKIYDLTERVIPAAARPDPVPEPDFIDWACRSALDRLGFGTPTDIARFWDLITPAEAATWAFRAAKDGHALPALSESADGSRPQKVVARPDWQELTGTFTNPPGRLRALNPFDPVLRDRRRLKRLFDFDYRIEIFVPAEKRRYGYYIFPLLEGSRLIGRIDMVADRAADALEVTALWSERGIRMGGTRQRRLEAELERLRRFAGLETVRAENRLIARKTTG